MKSLFKVWTVLLAVGFISVITSCGSDDCSDLSEWIGTYTLVGDTTCISDTSITIVNEIVLEPSSVAETFEYEGEPFVIVECTATDGFFTFEKDGNNLTLEINGTECSWEFRK